MNCRPLLVLAAAGMLLVVSCQGPKLTVATDATMPPLEFTNDAHQIVGLDVDLMKAVARRGGFTVEIISVPWDSIFAGLTAGKYDAIISGLTILDSRKNDMDFSEPYLRAGQTLMVKAGSPVKEIQDLAGSSLGTVWPPATATAIAFQDLVDFTHKPYDDLYAAISDVVDGRVGALLVDEPIALYYSQKDPRYAGKLNPPGTPVTEEYYGIAVKKGNTKVLQMINAGLKKVLESNEGVEIRKKWLE